MEWLSAAEFQYNDKKHIATGHISFKLNFGRYLQRENLTIKMELPKLEYFLEGLQKSWKLVNKFIEMAKEVIKKQFDKKRNSQRLKKEDNMQLEAKNIYLN